MVWRHLTRKWSTHTGKYMDKSTVLLSSENVNFLTVLCISTLCRAKHINETGCNIFNFLRLQNIIILTLVIILTSPHCAVRGTLLWIQDWFSTWKLKMLHPVLFMYLARHNAEIHKTVKKIYDFKSWNYGRFANICWENLMELTNFMKKSC